MLLVMKLNKKKPSGLSILLGKTLKNNLLIYRGCLSSQCCKFLDNSSTCTIDNLNQFSSPENNWHFLDQYQCKIKCFCIDIQGRKNDNF